MAPAVLVAALGVLTVALDAAVNIAFPAISVAFNVPATSIQWIVLTYMVTFAVALVPAGRLADRAGPARVFQGGLALTGVAHVVCGIAPAWAWLLTARVVQGLGAAFVMASAPALVTLAARPDWRGRGLGRLGLAASLGAVVGPLAGGLLVAALGWRVVYLARLPLVLIALGLCRRLPGAHSSRGSKSVRPDDRFRPTRAVSVRRPARADSGLADPRMFAAANGAHLFANVGLFAVWLLVPYYLIDRRGFPPGWGGLLFAAGPLAQACAAPLGGRLVDRGAGRWLAPLALILEASGLWLTGRLGEGATPERIVVALALGGFGFGLFAVANMHYVMSALSPARQGMAGSLVALMRTIGVVVGASVTTAVYASRLLTHTHLGATDAASSAFTDAFNVAAAVVAGATLLSLVPPRPRGVGRLSTP